MQKKHLKIIQDINKEVYEKYKDKLFREEYIAPEARKMAKNIAAGKHDDDLPQEKVEQIRAAYELGEYDKKRVVTDPLVAKQFDVEMQKCLVKAIKEGRIPNPKDDPVYKDLIK